MGELRGCKVAKKDQLCVGVSGVPVLTMLKRRDVTVGSGMFAENRPVNGLNKKSLSPASLYLTMKAKLLETMKEIPLLLLK